MLHSSAYYIFATKPQMRNQRPREQGPGGENGYLWAVVTKSPNPFARKIITTDGAGKEIFVGKSAIGIDKYGMLTHYLRTATKEGALHASKNSAAPKHSAGDSFPYTWSVKLAEGVDGVFALCVWWATQLVHDQLVQKASD